MQVLVDTSAWSLALRRPQASAGQPAPTVQTLRDLIEDGRAVMIGPIRQELLSGIKSASQFDKLRGALSAFDDLDLGQIDYETAAQFFNICRGKGIQGANTDYLICAAASARGLPILTTDQDFLHYRRHLPIELLE